MNRTLPHPSSRPSRSLSVRSTPSRNEPSDGVSASDRRISPSSISRRNVVLIGTSLSALSTLSPSGRAALAAELSTADPESLGKMLGLEEKVSEFTLSNGLRFVVLARPRAPVVSCYTFADVGAFEEVDGQTGLAHLLEHLAFKGSTSIGAKDFKREKPMLDSLDEVFYALREAREGGRTSEATRLQEKMNELIEQAEKYVIPNAFGNLMENQGAVGLNAQTSQARHFLSSDSPPPPSFSLPGIAFCRIIHIDRCPRFRFSSSIADIEGHSLMRSAPPSPTSL